MTTDIKERLANRVAPAARLIGPIVVRGTPKATSARRTARRNLRLMVFAFLIIQFGTGVAIERDWWPIADPIYTEKAELFRKHSAFVAERSPLRRVLALGSSRTQLAFDAERFSAGVPGTTAFNFGTPGGGPLTCRLYWNRLHAEGFRPEVVFVEVHPALWCTLAVPFEARWLQEYRLKPGEPALLRECGWPLADPPQHDLLGKFTTTDTFRLGLLNRHAPALLPCRFGLTIGDRNDAFGYVRGIDIADQERPRAFERAKAEYGDCFPAAAPGGAALAAVRRLLADVQAAGAEPILLVYPEAAEMQSWYGPHHPEQLHACLTALQREFGVTLLDGRGWVEERHFVDGHHLSAAGGAQFTDRLIAAANAWDHR